MGNPDPQDRIDQDEVRETAPAAAPPTTPSGGSPPMHRRPLLYVALLVFLGAFAGAFVLLSGSEDASAEVILEPTAASGADPFTESVATEEVELAGGEVEQVSGGGASVESVDGSTPGLYGGTGEEAVCDPEALVAFLEDNPDKAAAFAAPLAIKPQGDRRLRRLAHPGHPARGHPGHQPRLHRQPSPTPSRRSCRPAPR